MGGISISSHKAATTTITAAGDPAPQRNQRRPRDQSGNDDPIKRKREMIVRVVDSDHEPVLVPYHLEPRQIVTHASADEKESQRRRAGISIPVLRSVRNNEISMPPLADLGQSKTQLPAARHQPVDKNRKDDHGEQM